MSDARKAGQQATFGVINAVIAHLTWGAMAPYLGLIRYINPLEISVHRGLWSIPLAGLVVWYMGLGGELWAALRNRKLMLILAFTSFIVFFNWAGYIWCIQNGKAMEASLGYFVNPLLNVAAGYVFLGERFNKAQLVAIILAVCGVFLMAYSTGVFPYAGLLLGMTFCTYGLVRKMAPVSAVPGFLLEVMIMAMPLLTVEWWLANHGGIHFGANVFDSLMLAGAGVFTTVALITYAWGVRSLRYSTAGLIQYLTPSLVFLSAIFTFGETVSFWKLVSFGLIWLALAVYSMAAIVSERSAMQPA